MNYKILSVAILGVSSLGMAGCKDSGSDPVPIPLETSNIRAYKQGDTIKATMTFTDTQTGDSASGEITSTLSGVITNPSGVDCQSVVVSGTLTGPGGTVAWSSRTLVYQDADNSLYDCGTFDENAGQFVFITDTAATPNGLALELKSPVKLGNTVSTISSYTDGTWEDCTTTVVAKENVSVPVGFYESYKIQESCTDSTGSSYVGESWFVPTIEYLKAKGTFDTYSVSYDMTSYSFN